MKKQIVTSGAILLIVAALFSLTACSGGANVAEEPNDLLSYCVTGAYTGESELFFAEIYMGKRETTFVADGVNNDVKPFCELKITPLSAGNYDSIEYTVSLGETECSDTISAGALSGTYVAETEIKSGEVPTSVTVKSGEITDTIPLSNLLEGKLSASDILNIAEKEFESRISDATADGKELQREVYLKLVSGDRTNYYWYVSYIGSGNDYWALLINPVDGNVVSKK